MKIKAKNVQVGDFVVEPYKGKVTRVITKTPNTFPSDPTTQIEFGIGAAPLALFAEEFVEISPRQQQTV